MEKFNHRKLLMPSYLSLQLSYIRDNKTAYNGGYFAGSSLNKYYAKKQHKNHITKYFNIPVNLTVNILKFNLN